MDKNCNREQMEMVVMQWYGWGSPVGLTIFLLGVGGLAALIRYAILG